MTQSHRQNRCYKKYRQMKSDRLLNGGGSSMSLLHTGLDGGSGEEGMVLIMWADSQTLNGWWYIDIKVCMQMWKIEKHEG